MKMLFADHTRLSVSPIKDCELQSSLMYHLSHLWWQKATSHGMLSEKFGNVSLTGDSLANAQPIDSAMLSLAHKMFSQRVPWFKSSIQLAASQMWCSLRDTLEKLLLLRVFCRALPRTNLHISALCTGTMHQKVASGTRSFSYSQEKMEKAVCVCFLVCFFSWMTKFGTLRSDPFFFPECPTEFHDFQEGIWWNCNSVSYAHKT